MARKKIYKKVKNLPKAFNGMQLYQDSLYQDDQSIGNGMSLIDPNLTAASDLGYSLTQSFAPQTNTVAPSVEQPTTADKVGNAIGQISEVGSGMNNAVNMFKNFSNNTNAITGGASIFKQAANTEGLAKAIQASVSPTKDGAAAASAGGVVLGSGVSSAANIGAGIGGAAASMLAEAVNMRKAYGNDRGVSSRAEKRMSAAGKGMDAAMMGTSFIPGVGGFISLGIGAAKLGMMGISALVDRIKEKREGPLRPDFNPIMKNVMTPNWVPTAAYGLPLAKFGLPLMHQPNVEAEGNEATLMQSDKGDAYVIPINGKSHEQGGEEKNYGPDGKYIFSKSLGYTKDGTITIKEKEVERSFAQAAKAIEQKYKGQVNDTSLNTKQLELDWVTADAEKAREIKKQLGELKKVKQQIMKFGGYLLQAGNGLPLEEAAMFTDQLAQENFQVSPMQQANNKRLQKASFNLGYMVNKGFNNQLDFKYSLPSGSYDIANTMSIPFKNNKLDINAGYNKTGSVNTGSVGIGYTRDMPKGKLTINAETDFTGGGKAKAAYKFKNGGYLPKAENGLIPGSDINVLDYQNWLVGKGLKLPKSTKSDGTLDGIYGGEVKSFLDKMPLTLYKNDLLGAKNSDSYFSNPTFPSQGVLEEVDTPVVKHDFNYPAVKTFDSQFNPTMTDPAFATGFPGSLNTGVTTRMAEKAIPNLGTLNKDAANFSKDASYNRGEYVGRTQLAAKNPLLTPGDKMSLASMAPATLFNSIMAMRKPDVEKFQENNYANAALALASRRFDDRALQAKLIGDVAGAKQNISDMKGLGTGATLANMQGLYNNLFANRQQLEGEKQKINLGLDQQQAQMMNQMGELNRGERVRVSDVNAKNKAARQAFGAEAVNNIGQTLATTGQGMNAGLLNKIGLSSLSSMSKDFNFKGTGDLYKSNGIDELFTIDPKTKTPMINMAALQNLQSQGYDLATIIPLLNKKLKGE